MHTHLKLQRLLSLLSIVRTFSLPIQNYVSSHQSLNARWPLKNGF